jgi:hypothetical protein
MTSSVMAQGDLDLDPDQARETADEILLRPEFRAEEPSLLDRAIDWVLERLGDVLTTILPGGGGTVIGWLVLMVALALIAYLVWRFAPHRLSRLRQARLEPDHELIEGRTRDQWLAEAEAAERDGDWARGVQARWHALVAGLADRSQLADDPAATSGEHRRSFATGTAADPGRVDRFGGATELYEDIWFGGRPAGPDDRDALARDDQALLTPAEERGS